MLAYSPEQTKTASSDSSNTSSGNLDVETVLDVHCTSQLSGHWETVRESEKFILTHIEEMAAEGGPLWKLPVVHVEVSGSIPNSPFPYAWDRTIAELESQGHTAASLKRLSDRLIKMELPPVMRFGSLDSGIGLLESPIIDRQGSLPVVSHTARQLFPDLSDSETSEQEGPVHARLRNDEPNGAWRLLGVFGENESSSTAVVAVKNELWLVRLDVNRQSCEQRAMDYVNAEPESQQLSRGYPDLRRGFSSAGWAANSNCDGRAYAVGGYDRDGFLRCVKTCAPGDREWQTLQHLQHVRARAGAGIIDNALYVVGGSDGRKELNTVERLQLQGDGDHGDGWCHVAAMQAARSEVAVATVNQLLFAAGGTSDGISSLQSAELYSPTANMWKPTSPMLESRLEAAAATLKGKVYVAGGSHSSLGCIKTAECYDPTSDCWSTQRSLRVCCRGAAMATHNGALFLAGGYNGSRGVLSDVQACDPRDGPWQKRTPLLHARSGLGIVSAGELLLVVGGYGETNFINIVEVYDPRMDSYITLHGTD